MAQPAFARSDAPAEAVIDALRGSKIVRDAIAASATQVADQRKRLAAELAALERDSGDWEAASAEIEAARAAVTELEQKLREAKERFDRARLARASHSHSIAARRDEIVASLRETAPPLIAAFIREMWAEVEKVQKAPVAEEIDGGVNPITGKRVIKNPRSNLAALVIRHAAVRHAIEKAEALKLAPDQTSIAAQLEHLRAELPSSEEMHRPPKHGSSAMFADLLHGGMSAEQALKEHCGE